MLIERINMFSSLHFLFAKRFLILVYKWYYWIYHLGITSKLTKHSKINNIKYSNIDTYNIICIMYIMSCNELNYESI